MKLVRRENETVSDFSEFTITVAVISLFLITIIIDFYVEFFIGSIGNFTVKIHISDGFVALILISIIGNAAEYITVIIEIFKNKMNFVLGIVFRFGV
jgi:calcium/proton exchanger cax